MRRAPITGALMAIGLFVALALSSCSGDTSSDGGAPGTTAKEAAEQTSPSNTTSVDPVPPAGDGHIGTAELRRERPIVFVRADSASFLNSKSGDLYVARADGSNVREIPMRRNWGTAFGRKGGVEGVATVEARWSPDRRWIALAQFGWAGDPYVWAELVSADGASTRVLTRPHWDGPYDAPSWSPDGKRVLIQKAGRLQVFAVSGGRPRVLRVDGRFPDWSPDGSRIAVATYGTGIALTSPTGEPLRYLVKGNALNPAWSPDSLSIVFARASPERRRGIWVIDADGSDLRRLTSGADESPRWSPDGTKILFRRLERRPAPRFWTPKRGVSWELYVMDADGARQTHLPFNHPPTDPRIRDGILSADWGR